MIVSFKLYSYVLAGILVFMLFSCKGLKPISKLEDDKEIVSRPTQKEIIDTARSFLQIYLKHPDIFLKEADELMGQTITAEFQQDKNRWYLFFTNGFSHLHVELDSHIKHGTVYSAYGPIVTKSPYLERPKSMPLFSLEEFQEMLDLPHNRDCSGGL